MTLLAPWFLLLALLVPLALWRRGDAPSVLFAPRTAGLPRSWRVRLLPLPHLLHVAGLLLLVVALARPAERIAVAQSNEGIDIMLCLDTSSSMASNDLDVARTRLDIAKDAAARFIAGRPDDRIGILSFARYPDVRCPPTLDHEALQQFLASVTLVRNDGPEDATGIGTAVARAAQVLRGGVVILLTDGEENVATAEKKEEIAPLHAGQLCRELGVRAYAVSVGLGSRTPAGEWTALDTRQIRILADRTGGRFYEARDAGAVAQVYGEIDQLEKVAVEKPRYEILERFLPFLALALLLLFAARLLRSTILAVAP